MHVLLPFFLSLAFFLGTPSRVHGQVIGIQEAPGVEIYWQGEAGFGLPEKSFIKNWQKVCKVLGKSLQPSSGPWGFGVFSTSSCHFKDKKVSGKKLTNAWRMNLSVDAEQDILAVRIFATGLDPDNKEGIEVANLLIPFADMSFKLLRSSGFAKLISAALLDQLPMAWYLKHKTNYTTTKDLRGGKVNLKLDADLPPPPEKLVLFKVEYDVKDKAWRTAVMTDAHFKKQADQGSEAKEETAKEGEEDSTEEKGKKDKVEKKSKKKKGKTSNYTWEMEKNELTADMVGIWAQVKEGRGTRTEEFQRAIEAYLDQKITGLLKDLSFAIGLNTMFPIYGSTFEPKKNGFIGVDLSTAWKDVGSVRVKPEAWTYTVPIEEGSEGSFSGYRVSGAIEYSWFFNAFINRLYLSPMMTYWSVNTKANVDSDEVDLSGNVVTKIFSGGGEIGIESLGKNNALALWGGFSMGKGEFTKPVAGDSAGALTEDKADLMQGFGGLRWKYFLDPPLRKGINRSRSFLAFIINFEYLLIEFGTSEDSVNKEIVIDAFTDVHLDAGFGYGLEWQ